MDGSYLSYPGYLPWRFLRKVNRKSTGNGIKIQILALFLRKTITYVHNSTYIAQLEEHICLTTRQNQSLCEVGIPEPEGTTLQRNISLL